MNNEIKNKLILGDCLEVMKKMPNECVDLIYLDPPFFSNQNYELIWGDEGEVRSFSDRWSGGIDQYINWLYDRVKEMHRVLKKTGSIYLHCDWHADAYIRVQVLDKIFGMKNFRNEIIWKYFKPNSTKQKYPKDYDVIFFYSKSNKWTFNYDNILTEYDEKAVKRYDKTDKDGRKYKIYNNKDGTQRISYMKEGGTPTSIFHIPFVQGTSKERAGWKTQKPLALVERIIRASSNEGDVVMDPFMGGGTTIVMAAMLGRKFIGIDSSVAAVDVSGNRLRMEGHQERLKLTEFETEKLYYAEEDLKAMDAFKFEKWIVEKFGGNPNTQQRGDFGSDGEKDGVPIQVKRWKHKVGRVEIQKFFSVCHAGRKYKYRKEAGLPVGYFIAFDFAKEAVAEMARLKMDDGILIEKVLVGDIVPMAKKPVVRIEWSKTEDGRYEFRAISDSPIMNYSWDFEYLVPAHKFPQEQGTFKPSVLYDNKGVRVHNFSVQGNHNIAVKVVDDKSLENIAVCSISI